MCYSAQIAADYRKYVHVYGADIDINEFVRLFWDRRRGSKSKFPKAMEAALLVPQNDAENRIKDSIAAFSAEQTSKLELDLFKQRARLADAERTLLSKTTKAAVESRHIATDKIDWIRGKPEDFRRTDLKDRDSRIFPGQYAPVMVVENGHLVVKPMRYQCRLANQRSTTQNIRAPITPDETTLRDSEKACLATRTA